MHAHLEIYRIWWTWRGCLQDYYKGSNTRFMPAHDLGKDVMDRVDYNEATAFPMMKPNFDVFGTPARTRSQRGWYQVQRHPRQPHTHTAYTLSHPPSSSENSTVSASATGAHLPIELVQLTAAMISATLDRDNDKRTLMSCALVCRYWATWFLPQIFVQVSVHSRKSALELQAYDRSPACQFFRVSRPDVSVQVNRLVELNYIHLIAQTRSEETSLALRGPVPRGWKTIRSIHQALPQSMPRLFSSKIAHLALADIHFQRFADLVHLVCELPDLESLDCKSVTWTPPLTAVDAILRRRVLEGRDSLKSISMEKSSETWVQAAVHIYTHFLSTSVAFFPNNTLTAIAALAELLHCAKMSSTRVGTSDIPLSNGSVSEIRFFSYYQDRSFELDVEQRDGLKLCIWGGVHPDHEEGSDIPHTVTHVTVESVAHSDADERGWDTLDWHEFDKHVSSLNPTHLVFGFRSRARMLRFGREVVDTMMPDMFTRDSIKYGVMGAERWHKASRDMDVLRTNAPGELPKRAFLRDIYPISWAVRRLY